jgi:hypothetical protein
LSLSRRTLLASAAALGVTGLSRAAASPRRLVLVLAHGGWDVTYGLDPKLGIPGVLGPDVDVDLDDPLDRESVETVGGHPIAVNDAKRPAVRGFFESWGSRTDVINGLWVGAIGHESATVRVLTGTPSDARPDVAVIAGATLGNDLPLGCVDLGGQAFAGEFAPTLGRIGARGQLKLLLDDAVTFPAPANARHPYPLLVPSQDERSLVDSFLRDRLDAEVARTGSARRGRLLADFVESMDRVGRFRERADEVTGLLELGAIPSFDHSAELAVALLEGGVCHSVVLDSGRSWDTHYDSTQQHGHYDGFFDGLDRLLQQLDATGLLASTTVAVVSEMTRAPSANHRGGKDHWPYTSAMVVGAGVRGGRTLGGTDDRLIPLKVDLQSGAIRSGGEVLRPAHLCAGLLETVGVDPSTWFPDAEVYRGFRA